MANGSTSDNPLITTKAPDTPLTAQLHPLVLLTISDYITRHTIRQQQGPIVGCIIGEQNGHTFTLEAAYECKLAAKSNDTSLIIEPQFFETRLQQYKDVHKVPPLDLVGVFMLGSAEGPKPEHALVVKQIQTLVSGDSLLLLLFHPEQVNNLQGGKLPISLFECVYDQDGNDVQLRFREVNYEVETGEAERIGVDFVAKGGGNATTVHRTTTSATASGPASSAAGEGASNEKTLKCKEKLKETTNEETESSPTSTLSPEDEDLIASLTAKLNSIKMLHRRLEMTQAYLKGIPSSYLTDSSSKETPAPGTNYPLLRSIQAMVSRLPLLTPPSAKPLSTIESVSNGHSIAADREKQDVHLTSLLANITRAVSEAHSVAPKFGAVQREKQSKERGPFGNKVAGPAVW